MQPTNTHAIQIAAALTQTQREIFYAEFNRKAKDYHIALALAIILGWNLGAHKFYLGKPLQGLLHIVFVWTGIPVILTIIDIFRMHGTVDMLNAHIADEISASVRVHVGDQVPEFGA